MNNENKTKCVICGGDIVGMVITFLREKNVCQNCAEAMYHTMHSYRKEHRGRFPYNPNPCYRSFDLVVDK